MADPEKPAKPAPTPTSPEEIVALHDILLQREWNAEGKSFRNPITVMRSLLHHGRLISLRLVDVFRRLAATEARIKALEDFKTEAEAEAGEAVNQLEALITASQQPPLPIAAPPTPEPATALAIVPPKEKKEKTA